MAVLLLLLAIVGVVVVGDLVLENAATGAITLLHHPITGYSHGVLLAMAAALGFVLGLLVVGSVSMRQTRRARRRQLRTAQRELSERLVELERQNNRLLNELARREPPAHLGQVTAAGDPDALSADPAEGPRHTRHQSPGRAGLSGL